MGEQEVFAHLKKQKKAVLLDCLHASFQRMDAEQRQARFADAIRRQARVTVNGNRLWRCDAAAHEKVARASAVAGL